MTSPSLELLEPPATSAAQLIADPYSLGLILGCSPTHPPIGGNGGNGGNLLLLLSPDHKSILYAPYFTSFNHQNNFQNREEGIRIIRDMDSFIRYIRREKILIIDPAITHNHWEKVQPLLKKIKKWDWLSDHNRYKRWPKSIIHRVIDRSRQNHSQVEMAFIYGCSYIKPGVGIDEIRFQIHDYLQAKTQLRGEVSSRILCQSVGRGKKGLSALAPPSLIHFEIELGEAGVTAHFFKSVGLVDPLYKEKMLPVVNRYHQTQKLFKAIIKKITSSKIPFELKWTKLSPFLFKEGGWEIYFRCLFSDPGFLPIKAEDTLQLNEDQIYSLCLKDCKCDIIIGTTLIVNHNQVQVLEKYGWDYLQFPW